MNGVFDAFTDASKVDTIVFFAAGMMCIIGALGVVLHRNPVHSALFLVLTLFGVAVLFVAQSAHFLAAVQVIVYAGAVVVLFLFVIMLIGVDRAEKLGVESHRFRLFLSLAIGAAVLAEIVAFGHSAWISGAAVPSSGADENINELARAVFQRYLLPFELTSALLIISVIGAVVLARRYEYPLREKPEVSP